VISDIEHFVMYSLASSVFSLEKCLFKILPIFFALLLSCECSVYVLNIHLLSNIWFENIFSHSVENSVLWYTKVFNF
jgi:hypothetical protein